MRGGATERPPDWAIGHRGARDLWPENTVVAVREAIARGVRCVEVDIRLTADDVLVCSHDPSLRRLHGRDVDVRRTPWAELVRGSEGRPTAIPQLPEVLDVAEGVAELVLEVKSDGARNGQDVATAVAALLRRRAEDGRDDRVRCLSSFDHAAARRVRDLGAVDAHQTAHLLRHDVRLTPAVLAAARAGVGWIHPHWSLVLREPWAVRLARLRGLRCAVYTVNEPAVARIVRALGVEHVITDDPVSIG